LVFHCGLVIKGRIVKRKWIGGDGFLNKLQSKINGGSWEIMKNFENNGNNNFE